MRGREVLVVENEASDPVPTLVLRGRAGGPAAMPVTGRTGARGAAAPRCLPRRGFHGRQARPPPAPPGAGIPGRASRPLSCPPPPAGGRAVTGGGRGWAGRRPRSRGLPA